MIIHLFQQILRMSATASVAICAVLLVRLLLTKAPRKYSYLLWAIVGFRLACPISFRSAFSLFSLRHAAAPALPPSLPWFREPFLIYRQTVFLPPRRFCLRPPPLQPWTGSNCWPCSGSWGGVLIAGYSIFREAQLRSQLTTATRLDANIYCSEFVRSPFLLGAMRPRIYIPYGLDPQTQQFVLAHEQYHLRRLDHITRRISFLFLAIHWFNPLCWLAFALCGKDMELSCDEAVLRQEGVYSADCSTALLSFAVNRRMFSPAPWPLARPASRPASKTFCAGNAPSWE